MTETRPGRSVSGELIMSAFGPLAEALGQELSKAPAFVVDNLGRLARVFHRKRKDNDSDSYPSRRLFKQVLDEASWAEDEIVTEYLGGVLASSTARTLQDRGVTVTSTIRRLSSRQLRAHYIFYSELVRLAEPRQVCDFRLEGTRGTMHLEMDVDELLLRLGEQPSSVDVRRDITTHVILGLARERLIDENTYHLPKWGRTTTRMRLAIHPAPLGAELFLWGSGSPTVDQAHLLDPAIELSPLDDITALATVTLNTHLEAFEVARNKIESALTAGQPKAAQKYLEQFKSAARPQDAHVHFYTSIIDALLGSPESAIAAMRLCAGNASPRQIRHGLATLPKIIDSYPSARDLLLDLSCVLEGARKR